MRSSKLENQLADLQLLSKCVACRKLQQTIERNLLLIDIAKGNLKGRGRTGGKASKPDDLVRLYETLIENNDDLNELAPEGDVDYAKEVAAKALSYKAMRYVRGLWSSKHDTW